MEKAGWRERVMFAFGREGNDACTDVFGDMALTIGGLGKKTAS